MKKGYLKICLLVIGCFVSGIVSSQITERERDDSWEHLVPGGRFADRFLPMKGQNLSSDTWGLDAVLPRYIDNGIEDRVWSYWGGNIIEGEDGLFHLLLCGWLECSDKGHMEWSNSYTFNATSDTLHGPFVVRNIIGKGHNPEVFRLKDGRYALYVIDGYYVTDDLNGAWQSGAFEFDARDRGIIEGLSNLSFTQREDGSYLMVCRGGGIWISQDGLSSYDQLSDGSVYPPVEGRFEDPVIWRDHIQYHMIVNDWLGRIAYYLRSKNGVDWVVDPGEAYMPGIALHEDGRVEDWFKFERIKMFQDEYGRAIQANFAVIDTLKHEDQPFDAHSSKNICIPLNKGLLLELLNEDPITADTDMIRLKILAEEGFDPERDIDISSLRFGASSEVNFGRGCEVHGIEIVGNDLVVTFDGKGNGISPEEFAPKLIGKSKTGSMIYGYARIPQMAYIEPILSARKPVLVKTDDVIQCSVEVQNFGQVISDEASIKIELKKDGQLLAVASGVVPPLEPYETVQVVSLCEEWVVPSAAFEWVVTLQSEERELSEVFKETHTNHDSE